MNNEPKTKIKEVAKYLRTHRYISQLQATEMWKATRLSDIIYVLKNRYGWDIGYIWATSSGEYGKSRYKKYYAITIPEDSKI